MPDDMDESASESEQVRNASGAQKAWSNGERGRCVPDGERARVAGTRMALNSTTRAASRQSSFSLPKIRASSFVLQRRAADNATPADVPWGFDPSTAGPDVTVGMQNSGFAGRSRLLPVSRSLSLLDRARAPSVLWTSPSKDVGKWKDTESNKEMEVNNENETNKDAANGKDVDFVQKTGNKDARNLGGRIWSRGPKASRDAAIGPTARPKLSDQLFRAFGGRKHSEFENCKRKCVKSCKCSGDGKQVSEGSMDASKEESWKNSRLCSVSKDVHGDREREKDRPRSHSRGTGKPKMRIYRRSQSVNRGPNPNFSLKDKKGNSLELNERLPISPLTDDTKATSMVFGSFNNWRSRKQEIAEENEAMNRQKSKMEEQKPSNKKRWKGRWRNGNKQEGEEISEDEEILVIADVVRSLAHDDFIDFQVQYNKNKGKRRFRRRKHINNGDSSNEE